MKKIDKFLLIYIPLYIIVGVFIFIGPKILQKPEEKILYLDNCSYLENSIFSKNKIKYTGQKLENLESLLPTDLVISGNSNNFEELSKLYKDSDIVSQSTVAMVMPKQNIKNSNNIINITDDNICVVNLKKILKGLLNDSTWEDIGYNSDQKISLVIVFEGKEDLNIIISQIFITLSNKDILNIDEFEKLKVDVEKILSKAQFKNSVSQISGPGEIYIARENNFTLDTLMTEHKFFNGDINVKVYPNRNYMFTLKVFGNMEIEEDVLNKVKDTDFWNYTSSPLVMLKEMGLRINDGESFKFKTSDQQYNSTTYLEKLNSIEVNSDTIPLITNFTEEQFELYS